MHADDANSLQVNDTLRGAHQGRRLRNDYHEFQGNQRPSPPRAARRTTTALPPEEVAVRLNAHAARLWSTLLHACSIVWHVHVPKTAGSSIAHVLMNATGFVPVGARGRAFSSWSPYVEHGRKHSWIEADLLAEAKRRPRSDATKAIVTSETDRARRPFCGWLPLV